MTEFRNRSAASLSGGETQGCFSPSYLSQAPVLLLDEPTANLDPENVALVRTN
jgi:energy-coupling factor transporter ATP-binding protein EcfA2